MHNKTKRTKFDSKSYKGIFVDYVPNGYKILDVKSEKFIVARDVIFDEITYKTSRLELDDLVKIGSNINTDGTVSTGTDNLSAKGVADSKSVDNILLDKTDKKKCKQTLNEKVSLKIALKVKHPP